MTAEGGALVGGMANAGAVFRRGELVERPAPRNARALHAYLRALRAHGFDAAPVPVGLTEDGREQLTFIPGDVALPPFPDRAMTASALASVGSLLRRLHESSAAVPVDPRAAALIDFDLAAPGRPLWDVAMTARYWVPLVDPASASAYYPAGLDAPARLRILADAYGLPPQDRADLPDVVEQATAVCRTFVTHRVTTGDPAYLQALTERGGWARWDRLQSWLTEHREAFRAALLK
ncbi:BUD32 family EKC/KEOPS complex subunit [Streptomyces niveiscabiei]|uniref:Aminoglycoside phosphotransferase family protein n=1 Tax=Streptomyces niveiscabiei TaxID=164115 RepID=A0ABW9I5K5_9ACTN